MTGFVLRTGITGMGLWIAVGLVPGIAVEGAGTLLPAALMMGPINGLIRPAVIFFTLPLTRVTFGLWVLAVNAGLLPLTAALLEGFEIAGFFAALGGWFIVSWSSALASWFIGPEGRCQVLLGQRRSR
ncbi:MAG: phage holin family protein [Rhodospirillaceae bacterium]|nr:phage holin family protein [Rhodospirillaceae bacterium]